MDYNFCGFIWGPASKYTNEILENVNNKYSVLHYYHYNFTNRDAFSNSILDIYTTDDIDPSKVKNVKIKHMFYHPLMYTYFKFHIKEPNFRKKKQTGNDLSQVVEAIKKDIRGKYKSKIQNYIHDTIIHISDNFQQTKDIDIIMKKYQTNRTYEFINLKYFLKCNFKNNIFNRADILVRKYSIEQYLKDNTYDFSLYKEMQEKRTKGNSENYTNIFKTLIKSITENDFNNNYPISCSKNYLLLDGSHRTACSYYLDLTFIPIVCIDSSVKPEYSVEWFFSKKFSQQNIDIINSEIAKLNTYFL